MRDDEARGATPLDPRGGPVEPGQDRSGELVEKISEPADGASGGPEEGDIAEPGDGQQGAGDESSTSTATASGSDAEVTPRQRLARSITHPGPGQIIAAVMLFVVAIAGIAQVRSKAANDEYSSARQDDLVQILDGLNSESRRLESEIENLQQTRENLRTGADRERVARSETQQRVDDLGILAGTVRAEGEGVQITIHDPARKVTPELILEGVEELRDAGAEAIEIDKSVRVVASTSFGGSAGALTVDGESVTMPLVIDVIGDPNSLSAGANFRGGFADQVTGNAQGTISIVKQQNVRIDSLHSRPDNQYAQPASSPSARR